MRTAAQENLAGVLELPKELEGRLAALGLPVAGARLDSARAAATLLAALVNAPETGLPQALALAPVPGSADGLARSIRSAGQVLEDVRSTKWSLIEACRQLPDTRGEAGRILVGRVAEALAKDELAQALRPILRQAEDDAARLLTPAPQPKPEPPTPTPPTPPPTPPPPTDPKIKVIHSDRRAGLTVREFRKVADEIQTRLDGTKDGKLTISWEITGKE